MKIFRRPFSGRPGSTLLVGLLLLTLLVTAALAYQAQDAARSQRETAESALRDYAAFAAWQFAQNAREQLHDVLGAELQPVSRLRAAAPAESLPEPAFLAAARAERDASGCGCPGVDSIRYYFRLDLRDGSFRAHGRAPPAALQAWISDTVAAHARAVADPHLGFAAVVRTIDGRPRALVYRAVRDRRKRPLVVYGFEADAAGFDALFGRIVEHYALLPPSLTRNAPNDSLLAVAVLTAGGEPVFRSAADPGTFMASDTLGVPFGGLTVRASIRPAVAEQLLIGGLPRSRLPLLLGLLALTAGLIGVALLQMRREAAFARLRSDFVSGVSHELRTPLAQIRMFAETLLLGRVRSEAERRRSLEIIDQEARRLTHLVENVLHFSRSERRASRIDPEPTELGAQIRGIAESFAPLARARQADLRLELAGAIVAPVDRGALCQMLLNLLDNALKYGPPGQTVTVGMELADDRVRIRVDDQGPGIPLRDRRRVWEAFRRLERDRESAIGGSGIGLSVVRELALLHGGSAWADEAPGGGARFVVELPGARREPQSSPDSRALGAATPSAAEPAAREARGATV